MQRNDTSTTGRSASSVTVHHAEPVDVEAGLKVTDQPLSNSGDHAAQAEVSVMPTPEAEYVRDCSLGTWRAQSDEDCQHCKNEVRNNKAYDGWMACTKALRDRESEMLKAWVDEADSSLTFAALFSGVVTAFIVDSYTSLTPDSAQDTIDILRVISQQLSNSSAVSALPEAHPFQPRFEDVMRNILLFASLICALISSAMSIFIKSWSRESALDPDNRRNPRDLAYTREYRHEALLAWKMQDIVMSISMLLQVAVALFMVGIVLFVWRLGPVLRGIVAGLIMFWLALTLVSALCATVFPNCPFKSPVSRALFQAQQVVWGVLTGPFRGSRQRQHAPGYTSEEKEWRDVCRQQPKLASNALRYAFNVCWAEQEAATLFPCLEDVEAEAALKLVLALIRLRLGDIVQDASLGATAVKHMSPNSMEYQNLQSLSALAVKLVQERPDGLFAGSSTHRALGHHDKHLLETIRSYVAAA